MPQSIRDMGIQRYNSIGGNQLPATPELDATVKTTRVGGREVSEHVTAGAGILSPSGSLVRSYEKNTGCEGGRARRLHTMVSCSHLPYNDDQNREGHGTGLI